MLTITDINGNTEGLTGYTKLKRYRNVSGEKSVAFLVLPTEQNAHSFGMVTEESIVEFDGEPYRIKQLAEKSKGRTFYKEVVAVHTFFDLIDDHIYDLHTGSLTFANALSFTLNGSGYTWSIVDSFLAQDFENFGDDNRLALFQTILERYGAEFTLSGTVITLRKRIGNATDFQFRYNYNVKTIARDVNTNNLSTYIKGYGKQNEDGTYVVTSEYTSPNSSIFGIRHAKPVRDERYTTLEGLNARLVAELIDTPEVSITIDFADMRRAGYPYDVPNVGDDVFLIYEPIGIDVEARIVEVDEEFTEASDLPIATSVTLANIRESVIQRMVNTEKTVRNVVGSDGRVRYNALDAAVQRATAALLSAQTELEFENGIIARSKTNPNHLVLLNSAGIGISSDGGQTFREAITSDGFVLSAGAIGQLEANNIQIGAPTTFAVGYDPSTKETPEGAQAKAEAAVKVGEIFVRGTGLERVANRYLKINGNVIYDQGSGRGLRFTVLRKTDLGVLEDVVRDTYENESDRNDLAGKLNWYCDNDTDVIFVLSSYDAIGWNTYLETAVRRIGGAKFPWDRTPYALIGVPNIGEGAGTEVTTSTNANAPHAEITTKVIDGVPYGIDTSKLALVTRVRDDLRLTAPLPTSLTMNQDGITASTSDPNRYARMDYRGFYAKQGAFAVERPDGYISINDGVLRNSFSIQGSIPAFKTLAVEEFGQFYRTKSDARLENIQRFVFKHDSRYLRIICNMFCDAGEGTTYGNVGNIAFDVVSEDESTSITSAIVTEARHSDNQGYRKDILLDLGTPTGNLLVVYWRMWNAIAGWYTYGSVRYLVAEG